ncbi:MAG: hypothetical protein LBK08_11715 [Treponema sp.]|jgi:hypothetical protein|nr:hypothetical protein [Treponema sp.]
MAIVTSSNGVAKVIENINSAFGRRKAAALVICKKCALLSKQALQESQGLEQNKGQFWTNRTRLAIRSVRGFTIDYKLLGIIGFGLAHGVKYGKSLELSHNRKHAVLEQTVRDQVPHFMNEIKKVFSD